MAPIELLLFIALSLSISGLVLVDPLLTFANQNPNNSIFYAAVHTFLFFVLPFTFISAIILIFVRVAVPQSAFFIKHLTMAILVLVSLTLLLEVPLTILVAFNEVLVPDPWKTWLCGTEQTCIVMALVICFTGLLFGLSIVIAIALLIYNVKSLWLNL